MDVHPVPTIPNHHPIKMDVLPKTFVQIILAAKWLVRPPSSSDDLCLLQPCKDYPGHCYAMVYTIIHHLVQDGSVQIS